MRQAALVLLLLECGCKPKVVLAGAYTQTIDGIRSHCTALRRPGESRVFVGVIHHDGVRRISSLDPRPTAETRPILVFDTHPERDLEVSGRTFKPDASSRWFAVSEKGVVTVLDLTDEEERDICSRAGKLQPGPLWESKIKPALLK